MLRNIIVSLGVAACAVAIAGFIIHGFGRFDFGPLDRFALVIFLFAFMKGNDNERG